MTTLGQASRPPAGPAQRPLGTIEELDLYLDRADEPNLVQVETHVRGHLDRDALAAALAEVLAAVPEARRRLAAVSPWDRRLEWQTTAAGEAGPGPFTVAGWDSPGELAAVRERLFAWPLSLHDATFRLVLAVGPDQDVVILQVHHAAFDGISSLALLRAICAAYQDRAGTAPAAAASTGAETGPGTGAETGPGTGAETGPGTGAETGPGTGAETGPGTGAETGPGTGAESAQPAAVGTTGAGRADQVGETAPVGGVGRRAGTAPMGGTGRRRPGRMRLPGTVTRIAPQGGIPRQPGYGFVLASIPVPRPPRQGSAPYPTVNDLLVAALTLTVHRWNTAHGRRSGRIRVTVPVNARDPAQRWQGYGNLSRLIRVSTRPRQRTDPAELPAQVAAQTRAGKKPRRAEIDAISRLLAAGWAPAAVKRRVARLARRLAGPVLTDTTLLTNLGAVPDPPCFTGPAGPLWIAAPAPMPRGLSVGGATVSGQLCLSIRYRRALLDQAAAAAFAAAYGEAVTELASPRPRGAPQ